MRPPPARGPEAPTLPFVARYAIRRTADSACAPALFALAILCLVTATGLTGCATGDLTAPVECPYSVDDPQFRRTLSNLLGPPLVEGNQVTTLVNGDQIFPSMLEAIRAARSSITMETYIYWSGTTGAAFTAALTERARAGVRVHILIDAVGSDRIDKDYITTMRDAGADVFIYHALHWYDVGSAVRLNNRTHRRLLVIDGLVAFTGGVGIGDEWLGDAQDQDHWRDNHYRVEGPVVAQLQAAFTDNWLEATGHILHDSRYFPALNPAGPAPAQMFKSSWRGGSESMRLMYLLSIAAARKSIRLSTPYFVPDDLTMKALLQARQRGVRIQIIVPGPHIDLELVRKASRSFWGDLLEAGVEIYEYQPTMYHCKLMVVDDLWSSIGSANLDNRSFKLNAEANLNVLDADFAAVQARVFESDLARSKLITLQAWKDRPLHERFMEHASSILSPQL